jgi:hypothetical protein
MSQFDWSITKEVLINLGMKSTLAFKEGVKLKNAPFFCAKLNFILFWPMLGRYPENSNILIEYCLGYHFWNPLDIKSFDIQKWYQSYNIQIEYFFWKYDIQGGY